MLPLVVIAIVIHQSPESMKTYRRFIIHFTVCDFCFSVCMGMLVKPFPIIPFFAAFVIGPLKYLGSAGAVASGSAIMISAGYAIATQCICIVYRFAAIQTDPRLLAFVVSWISWTIGHIIGVFISVFAILLLMQVQVPQEVGT
ncbi:unnamed protein product [Bursaphelenchus okinawaensis]|uniref:Uncharacterized protein n=1 Tax=Bursaphelenchus okinawaensis TaxID=465554 RepID=A0A811KFY0_9BILA|nr:unnamed protein product [Bursaphelenchus okinawaensis]CAG9102086.1 unnamed protein product [Bursaphelenchus okinawaensis]